MSVLAWARQPPGAPGHNSLNRVAEQLACLRAVGLDPACADGIHAERLRKLAREGGRFTAQHLRMLSSLRRRATLVATVLDTTMRLTDDGIALFDRAVGRMFRRAERREENALLRDARAVNDKVRLLAKLGTALIKAKADGGDLDGAVATAVGWEKLAASVAEAERLARPDKADLPALATRAWPVLHRLGPVFLDAFKLRAVPAAAATLRAVELLHDAYRSGGRTWPESLPVSFLRVTWRGAVLGAAKAGGMQRRIWEAATLLALRDRLRAGDIWVEGSRQWRAVEDQLIPPALFNAMRAAGPLPVAVPATAEEYLAERRALLDRRLADVAAKAAANALEDVTIKDSEMKITPLKAVTPEAADDLADRLYAMIPNARITSLLADVHRWTGFADAFTHLQSGLPADDSRVVLTAVLADATNLGLSRMAEACSVASLRTARLDRRLAPARGHLSDCARHVGQRPARPAARRIVRGGRRVQLGRSGFPHRRTRRGRRCHQCPLRARGVGAVLHAHFGPPCARTTRSPSRLRRGRPRDRRAALSRGGPQHFRPSYGRRRGE